MSFRLLQRSMSSRIVEQSITRKLTECMAPTFLEVTNESYKHNVPPGSESHFKVVVVSSKFNGMTLIKRHKLVNALLKQEFDNGLHALSIMAKTPEQWNAFSEDHTDSVGREIYQTPDCLGGSRK